MWISLQVHRSHRTSYNASIKSESNVRHSYADIGIESYFNDENALPEIDPNIAEDARLDTVMARFVCKIKNDF